MIAGHYATALVAKEQAPLGHLAYYLAASQLPDLAWIGLSAVGLGPVHTHAGPMHPEMMVSHDLVPTVGWMALAVVVGRVWSGAWGPGWIGGALVALHIGVDLLAGYPHYVMGPRTAELGTAMYLTAPYLAVAIEAAFAAVLIGWVANREWRSGRPRGAVTWAGRVFVFGGGIGSTFLTADQLATFDPNAGLPLALVAVMMGLYGTQMAILAFTERR